MHAAPAFQIAVRHFGIWRSVVAATAALDLATITVWCFEQAGSFEMAPSGLALGAVLAAAAGLASVAIAASLIRIPPSTLRWDGQVWRLASAEATSANPVLADAVLADAAPAGGSTGSLSVAIDLGRWLLLRFDPDGPDPAPVRWLPIQRLGIESQWHALRCSVIGARPGPLDDEPATGV